MRFNKRKKSAVKNDFIHYFKYYYDFYEWMNSIILRFSILINTTSCLYLGSRVYLLWILGSYQHPKMSFLNLVGDARMYGNLNGPFEREWKICFLICHLNSWTLKKRFFMLRHSLIVNKFFSLKLWLYSAWAQVDL